MSPSTRPSDIKPTSERRRTYGPVRLGKSIPGLPVRCRRRYSDASIWVLVICIAAALILRNTADAASQENPQGYVPGAIRFLEDVEVVVYSAIGTPARLLSLATDTEVDALFLDLEERLKIKS